MSLVSKTTKGFLGVKAAKGAAKNPRLLKAVGKTGAKAGKVGAKSAPPLAKLGFSVGKPIAKRRTRKKLEEIGETVGTILAAYGPQAAEQLGLVEPPKEKKTAPRVAAGMVIGASAVYFLEPKHGAEHREQVLKLVS